MPEDKKLSSQPKKEEAKINTGFSKALGIGNEPPTKVGVRTGLSLKESFGIPEKKETFTTGRMYEPEKKVSVLESWEKEKTAIQEGAAKRKIEEEALAARKKELDEIASNPYMNIENLFTVLKDKNNVIDIGMGSTIKSAEELDTYLSDKNNINNFWVTFRSPIYQYFGKQISSENDFTNVLAGGLSSSDKEKFKISLSSFTGLGVGTIFDPLFNRKGVGPGQLGYRPEFDPMLASDAAVQNNISQRQYQAKQQFDLVTAKGLNKTANGDTIDNYEDYYKYLMDPINRDAYGIKYKAQIKNGGFESAQKILEGSNVFVSDFAQLGAVVANLEENKRIVEAKADDTVAKNFLGQNATVNDGSKTTVAGLTEEDLGRIVYENELGNAFSYTINDPDFAGGKLDLNYVELEKRLSATGLGDRGMLDERLDYYKKKYINSIVQKQYEGDKLNRGSYVDPETGKIIFNYDVEMEKRALGSLNEKEQAIAELYDEVRAIYATADMTNPKAPKLRPDQLQRVQKLQIQISDLKKQLDLQPVEFFGPNQMRLEGEAQTLAKAAYDKTLAAEKKTDMAMLKDKRNALYALLDWYKKMPVDSKMPLNISEDELDEALESQKGFLKNLYDVGIFRLALSSPASSILGIGQPKVMLPQEKIMAYRELQKQKSITEIEAQLKAINKIIYLNVDTLKNDTQGTFGNFASLAAKQIKSTISEETFLTPQEELQSAVNFFTDNGMYVPQSVRDRVEQGQEAAMTGEAFLESIKAAVLIGLATKGVVKSAKDVFTGQNAMLIRSYMGDRYGKTGIGVFNAVEKAIVNYGVPYLSYEITGNKGEVGVAETIGAKIFEKVTGVLKVGKLIGTTKMAQLFYTAGRIVSGGAAAFTEEAFSNTWQYAKQNGFDFVDAAKNAFGTTEDERLLNLRATAIMCFTFSAANLENLKIVFGTRKAFQQHIDNVYGGEPSETDQEILDLLDRTIKNSNWDENMPSGITAAAAPININQTTSSSTIPVDYTVNMTEPDVPNNLRASTTDGASGSVGNNEVVVEKRTGNIGEEFYVAGKDGVVDNKVVYRYNAETGKLEARGLTSTTDEFVVLNDKTRDFVETKSQENGIVAKDKAETIARKNLGISEVQEKKNDAEGKVLYQTTQNESGRRKKERTDKASASASAEYQSKFAQNAKQTIALFTGKADNVDEGSAPAKKVITALSKGIGSKIKVNLSSFISGGKAMITNNVRKKYAKVADYIAPLLYDYDSTLFTKTGVDPNTGTDIMQRKPNNLDKFRAAVNRSRLFADTYKKFVDDGTLTQEDAVDNLVANLLLNKTNKIKELFGNDTQAIQSFQDLRKDFNNFVAVKYTGASSFNQTEKFSLVTPMATITTKMRKTDMGKQAADVAKEQERRNEIAGLLSDTSQGVDVEHVDGIRFLENEISAEDYLKNMGIDTENKTPDQIQNEAKQKAESSVDVAKYNEAVERRKLNDAVRTKWKKELNRQASNIWGLKSKTPFKQLWYKSQRKGLADLAVRMLESDAQRIGMTLDEFMKNMIEVKKMTQEEFNKWLNTNPGLVPFFQNNLSPEQIAADVNKAMELRDKNMDPARIQLMTGVSFDANGNPVYTGSVMGKGDEYTQKFTDIIQSVYEFVKSRRETEITFNQKVKRVYSRILGRTPRSEEFKTEKLIFNLSELMQDEDFYRTYPDMQLATVRFVDEPGTPAFRFVPNYAYSSTQPGKEGKRPGDVVINLATMKNPNELQAGITRAMRKGAQFLENEYTPPPSSRFVSPTAIRTAAKELQANNKLTAAQANMVTDILDFYTDKAIFQFSQYRSLFSDIAKILYHSNVTNLTKSTAIDRLAIAYGLSNQEVVEFKNKVSDHLTKMRESGEDMNVFLNVALRLAELTDSQIMDEQFAYEFDPNIARAFTIEGQLTEATDYVKNNQTDIINSFDAAIAALDAYQQDANFTAEEKTMAIKLIENLKNLKSAIEKDTYYGGMFDYVNFMPGFSDINRILQSIEDTMNYMTEDIVTEDGDLKTHYRDPETLTFDAESAGQLLDWIANEVDTIRELDNRKVGEVIEEDVVADDTTNRQMYYQMFPGIDAYMDGIFDAYKPVSEFTKEQLRKNLVDSGLMTEGEFNFKYQKYQEAPELFKGSAASVFADPTVGVKGKGKKEIVDEKLKQMKMMELRNAYHRNIGTAFYNNIDMAIAQMETKSKKADVKRLLENFGARKGEYEFMGIDEFLNSIEGEEVTRQQLMDWATSRPKLISYDAFSERQARSVENVYIVNNISPTRQPASGVQAAWWQDLRTMDLTGKPLPEIGGIYVTFTDGNFEFVDLATVDETELAIYEKYIGTKEFAALKKTIGDIQQIVGKDKGFVPLSAEQKSSLKDFVKIYVEMKGELDRKDEAEDYGQYRGNLQGAALPDTYEEHLLTIPISSHPYIKDINGKINDLLQKLAETTDPQRTEYGVMDPNSIEMKLSDLVAQRNSFIQENFNRKHWTHNPNYILAHARTEIAIDEFGDTVLYVHEIQSDQTQDLRNRGGEAKYKFILKEQPYGKFRTIGEIFDKLVDEEIQERINRGASQNEIDALQDYYNNLANDPDNMIEKVIDHFEKKLLPTLPDQIKTDYKAVVDKVMAESRKTTPVPSTEAFTNTVLKQLMSVASDKGVSKIVLTDPALIGPSVLQMTPTDSELDDAFSGKVAGINNYYNIIVPKQIGALQKQLGFEVTRTRLARYVPTVDQLNPEIQPLFNYMNQLGDFNDYVSAVGLDTIVNAIKKEANVDVTGKSIKEVEAEFDKIKDAFYAKERLKFFVPNPDFLTINLNTEAKNKVAEGMAMFQRDAAGAAGATVNMDTGKTIMFALSNPNISTAMHELAHVREKFLTADERQAFLDAVGHDVWTKETSEHFARGFEKYLATGIAPSSKLQKIFNDFKKWMLYIYGSIADSEIDVTLSEPMRRIYDAMLGEAKTTAQPKSGVAPGQDIMMDIAGFIDGIKNNPEFKGITDDELYSALLKNGFDPVDLQDYFALRQRANIEKQQAGGLFKEEADVFENEVEAMRTIRDQKALIDELDNIDPMDYPVMLQTLEDTMASGDVILYKEIQDLIKAKQTNADPESIREAYARILKMGSVVGNMLQLFRMLTKDSFLTNARAMFRRMEKKGLKLPDDAMKKIETLSIEVDKLKDQYKTSKQAAEADPYGISKFDRNMTNLEYNQKMYNDYQKAIESLVNFRAKYEDSTSVTDTFASLVKGNLMTPMSTSVNIASNAVKFLTGFTVDPLSSIISAIPAKAKSIVTGVKTEATTKKSLKDWWAGVSYGIPKGAGKAWRIIKNGTVVQSYDNPASYITGFNSFKSLSKFVGLYTALAAKLIGRSNLTNEEIALKYGFRLNDVNGRISGKQQLITFLQGTFGVTADIMFRTLSAGDAIFRDFAYYYAVSEQFKFSETYKKLTAEIKNASGSKKKDLQEQLNKMREAYIVINSDYGNAPANAEALRFVYSNENMITEAIDASRRRFTSEKLRGTFLAKVARLVGLGVVPFTKIPTNYAIELVEFLIPEYALLKLGNVGYKKITKKTKQGEVSHEKEISDARDVDRILARALVGMGAQYIARLFFESGAVSGSPQDENKEEKQKSMTYTYSLERPYSINVTLLRAAMRGDKSRASGLWDMQNDLIIDYRGFGIFGAAIYTQFKEGKSKKSKEAKFANRGIVEVASEDYFSSMFGNYSSGLSYIADQTFLRGISNVAKTIADSEDDNRFASGLGDFVLTLSAALVPNSTAWIDKMNRKYLVDYDAKDAPAFKAFGIKVEDPFATTFFTKLAIKMSERWPIGATDKLIDLPFIESELTNMPVKVDAFGKPVLQTPEGASLGHILYNTFDITKATRGVAGYETPDWESLVYLACKKGGVWSAIPSQMSKQLVDEAGNVYKLSTEQYNNLLVFRANECRKLIQNNLIKNGAYKEYIDLKSSMNYDASKKQPKYGKESGTLHGYELLGQELNKYYAAADKMTKLAQWTMIDDIRADMYKNDREQYNQLIEKERKSLLKDLPASTYGGKALNKRTDVYRPGADIEQPYAIDQKLVGQVFDDPLYFREFATGVIDDLKKYNEDINTATVGKDATTNKNSLDKPKRILSATSTTKSTQTPVIKTAPKQTQPQQKTEQPSGQQPRKKRKLSSSSKPN